MKKKIILFVAAIITISMLSSLFFNSISAIYVEKTAGTTMCGKSTNEGFSVTWKGSWDATKYSSVGSFDNSHKTQSGIGVTFYKAFVYFDTSSLPHYYSTTYFGGSKWTFDDVNYTITKVELCIYFTHPDYFYVCGNHSWSVGHYNGYAPTFPLVIPCANCHYDCPCDNLSQCLFTEKTMANSGWTNVTLNEWGIADIGFTQDSLAAAEGYPMYGVTSYGIFNANYFAVEDNHTTQYIQFQGSGDAHPPVLKIWYELSSSDPHFTSIDGKSNGSFFRTGTPPIRWTLESDTVAYHLQASTDNTFSNIVIDIPRINEYTYPSHYSYNDTQATFILPSEYRIASANAYYWRLIAYK